MSDGSGIGDSTIMVWIIGQPKYRTALRIAIMKKFLSESSRPVKLH